MNSPITSTRASILRGQTLFNSRPIAITGVNGINDAAKFPPTFMGRVALATTRPMSATIPSSHRSTSASPTSRIRWTSNTCRSLGVTRIVPVFAERSVVKVDASKGARKLEHWRQIAIAACEQCGRNRVPEVLEPIALGDAVRALPPGSARYLLAAGANDSLAAAMRRDAGKPVVLMIGPEGGLADAERVFAGVNGFTACSMGPRILRTETAGLAASQSCRPSRGTLSDGSECTACTNRNQNRPCCGSSSRAACANTP